jgi:hypothetical protein
MLATKGDTARHSDESGHPAALGAADGLSLAAAPTFAIMALLIAILGGGPADGLCSAVHASPFGGMVPMYVLMSAFHLTPWLKLVAKAIRLLQDALKRCPSTASTADHWQL